MSCKTLLHLKISSVEAGGATFPLVFQLTVVALPLPLSLGLMSLDIVTWFDVTNIQSIAKTASKLLHYS